MAFYGRPLFGTVPQYEPGVGASSGRSASSGSDGRPAGPVTAGASALFYVQAHCHQI